MSRCGRMLIFVTLAVAITFIGRKCLDYSSTDWTRPSRDETKIPSSPEYLREQVAKKPKKFLMIAIPLLGQKGYVKFSSSVLRTIHSTSLKDVHVFLTSDSRISKSTVYEWYGKDITLVQYSRQLKLIEELIEILKYFDDSDYENLLLASCDLIFSPSLFEFVKENVYETDFLVSYRSNANCTLTGKSLCLESAPRIFGSAMKKSSAELLIKNRLHLEEYQGVDFLVKGDGVNAFSPVDSLGIRIGQHFENEECKRYAEARNFDRCHFSKEIQDGLEFFLDRCNKPDVTYDSDLTPYNNAFYSKPAVVYSLYGGANHRYTDGAIENSLLMRPVYPEWKMWVYHDDSVPQKILHELCKNDVKLIHLKNSKIANKMSWRFLVAIEKVRRYIIRDIDSRLSMRERAAVDEWVNSSKKFHVMRDHPAHTSRAMNGGMWGAVYNALPQMKDWLENGALKEHYNQDQEFLNSKVWPVASKSVYQHDSFPTKYGEVHPFPTKRQGYEHVGSVVVDGTLRPLDIDILKKALEAEKPK